MRCPFCGHLEDKVVDSRESREGEAIRRRRECLACGRRFTSYERVEEVPLLIVKKDGRRESFDRQKLLKGMAAACQKRPVSLTQLEEAANDIQAKLLERPDREIPSRELGEVVMDSLKQLDSVAYVRFASVYREFRDLSDFVKHLEGLVNGPGLGAVRPVPPAAPESRKVPRPPLPEPTEVPEPAPTPLFPGLAPARLGPPKRRKGR